MKQHPNWFVIASATTLILWTSGLFAHPGHEHDHDDNAPAGLRTWTDAKGMFELPASFVSAKDGNVQLRKRDGKLVNLAIKQLSDDDQHWIEHRQAEIRQVNEQRLVADQLVLAPNEQQKDNRPAIAMLMSPLPSSRRSAIAGTKSIFMSSRMACPIIR